MLCDICGKNIATVHLTEIIDDQITELHLCEVCAREKSAQMEQQFGLSELLGGLVEFEKPTKEKGTETITNKCNHCGLSYTDFKKIGRLGCSECYTAFKRYLGPLLKRIHGSTTHFGKIPIKVSAKVNKRSLEYLRLKLKEAIEREAFEEAARIRDEIRELEKGQNK
ncbi:MAG: UvrB/UvrC motif-containing protein [Candidatus Omnitrophica bacterium]|nr:UvrB/UvrC motif-containing protein [Candidatus Omnitrophota bacterium]